MPGINGNAAYLDKTLRYQDVELGLDENVSWRTLFYLWLRAFIVSSVVWAVFATIGMILLVSEIAGAVSGAASTESSEFGTTPTSAGSPGFGGAETLFTLGAALAFVVFWVLLLVPKLREPIAEWRVLLADRGNKVDSVYSQISGTMRDRQLPLRWQVRRIRTGLGPENISNRLVVADRSYTANISVFSYGTGLYLGWAMWRSRRGASLIGSFVRDLAEAITGSGDIERRMMKAEQTRAMREALHAACREGLFTASEGVDVPLTYGFPQGLPHIEEAELGPAPVPAALYTGSIG